MSLHKPSICDEKLSNASTMNLTIMAKDPDASILLAWKRRPNPKWKQGRIQGEVGGGGHCGHVTHHDFFCGIEKKGKAIGKVTKKKENKEIIFCDVRGGGIFNSGGDRLIVELPFPLFPNFSPPQILKLSPSPLQPYF